ncbi:isopeptide-forming domain-containing fimbrial protein [Streptococcus sp. HN38]|uniref:isopeptide-forming domain-containing fimbrial protein n=1 Tax=Streptococcus sp. HN38 TaxID=3020829 RepID=UPI00232AC818|nr:isopeptide-forming domain-containing fimbrial protein [Streptococcus sp. HN38]
MKKLTKLFSLLTVLLTMFGPLGNLRHLVHANDAQPHQTKVVVHKVLMSKNDFDTFALKTDDEKTRNGSELPKDQFAGYFGQSATEISGVTFKVYKKITQENAQAVTGESLGISGDNDKYVPLEGEYGSKTTSESGAEFQLDNGVYIFVEDKVNSPYYNKTNGADAGKELTEAQAVPFRIELPITRPDGQGYFDTSRDHKLHIYPKNTENKPTVTKTFKDGSTENKNVAIGEEIEYKISTTIPKGSSYKTLVWEDTMLEGLDFVVNSITISSTELVSISKDTHFSQVEQDKRGFVLKANEEGLRAIEEAAKQRDITITVTYKGMLNDSAQVETLIPNQVTFHYGNRPRTFTDEKPKPVTPDPNGNKIVVNKTWGNAVGPHPEVKFDIYEQETGKKVGTVTLPANQNSAEYSTDLKAGVQYIVIEQPVSGFLPSYTVNGNGVVTVTNNPSDNPPPLVPEKPQVITHGKRFIKTDNVEGLDASEKLTGAEFVVMNGQNQYLALKSATEQTEALRKYNQAEQDYLAAVKAANGQAEEKKALRDTAYEALNMQWKWVADESQAFKFISSTEGKFEVKGLKAGTYYLKETKAPEGYALPSDKIQFTVNRGSWGSGEEVNTTNFQQVKNKKITIPQTGGIGTLVFTVVGLSTMVFAFIAMKKRQAEEA